MEEWGLPALHLQRVAGEEGPRSRRRWREDEEDKAVEPRQRRRVDAGSDGDGAGPSLAGWAHDGNEEAGDVSQA